MFGLPRFPRVTINKALQIVYILEFQLSTSREEGFLEVKKQKQMSSTKATSLRSEELLRKWEFEQINFVVGNLGRRPVVESDFYTKLKKLDV